MCVFICVLCLSMHTDVCATVFLKCWARLAPEPTVFSNGKWGPLLTPVWAEASITPPELLRRP